jgi:hypothetical protein
MEKVIPAMQRYLDEVLDASVSVKPWPADRVPFFLRDAYAFYRCSLLGTPCLLIVPRDSEEQTPAVLRKHIDLIREKFDGLCVYVHVGMSGYNRKRLIEQRIPFVIPGNQMYLPELGLDLREHFRKLRGSVTRLSPATQTVILLALVHDLGQHATPTMLAKQLGYTVMTMTRAFEEICSADLGDVSHCGRERRLTFGKDRRLLWQKARPFMSSPVGRRVWVPRDSPVPDTFVKAGLGALAHYTRLGEPSHETYAVGRGEWKGIQESEQGAGIPADPGSCELEIWRYSPRRFAKDGIVDRFSLYLSLQNSNDERVEAALEEMMEKVQ